MLAQKIPLYLNTLRYLRPVQIYGRVWFFLRGCMGVPSGRLPKTKLLHKDFPVWCSSALKQPVLLEENHFFLLNREYRLTDEAAWKRKNEDRLLIYHLHYFDDLCAVDFQNRRVWHERLIERWMAENPPFWGPGWEPYPLSLRLVNWVKWQLQGGHVSSDAWNSLALQARWLRNRLEFHILGNHLFVNAKALLFAGRVFVGPEAKEWYQTGQRLLQQELMEQILPDGGHFERSPMYHSLILEDVLDVLNLEMAFNAGNNEEWLEQLRQTASRMLSWLESVLHPDGQIPLLNDSVFGVAVTPDQLFSYAERLGLSWDKLNDGWVHLTDSGYVAWRGIGNKNFMVMDTGLIGPDYQPGHGHCDTLGFELSLQGQRVITDTGVFTYTPGLDRSYCRGTLAHNTLEVSGQEQSEIWGSFRVARRARPYDVKSEQLTDGSLLVNTSHDGYTRLGKPCVHRRDWRISESRIRICDELLGVSEATVVGRLHFAPDCQLKGIGGGSFSVFLHSDEILRVHISGAQRVELVRTPYYPEWGKRMDRYAIEVKTAMGVGQMIQWDLEFEVK